MELQRKYEKMGNEAGVEKDRYDYIDPFKTVGVNING